MPKLLYKEPEAREVLGGMSRDTFFRLIRKGRLKSVHIGRALYIPASELQRYVEALQAEANGDRDDV